MENFRATLFLFLINTLISCHAKLYEIDQEEFVEYTDNSYFKVWTYDEVIAKGYSVPVPPAGSDSSAMYLTDAVQPQYTSRYKVPSTGDVTFQATYYCDDSISEYEVRFSYPWEDHYLVMCGPRSGSVEKQWQSKKRTFSCLSTQGCSELDVWIYGITVAPGNVIGLQNLKFVTGDSTLPPTESTTPHSDPTTAPGTTRSTTKEPITTPITTASTTTRAPGKGLNCYSCIGCNTVDENTQTLQLEEYNMCVTTFFGGNKSDLRSNVIRGGSSENHANGECFNHDGMMDCYCGSDLCNDQNITPSITYD